MSIFQKLVTKFYSSVLSSFTLHPIFIEIKIVVYGIWYIERFWKDIVFCRQNIYWLTIMSKFLLTTCSSLECWLRECRYEKSHILQGHVYTDPPTTAVHPCKLGNFHDWNPGCHSLIFLSLHSCRLSLKPSVSLHPATQHTQLNLTCSKSNPSSPDLSLWVSPDFHCLSLFL